MTKRYIDVNTDSISIGWLDKVYKSYKIATIIADGKISYVDDEVINLGEIFR